MVAQILYHPVWIEDKNTTKALQTGFFCPLLNRVGGASIKKYLLATRDDQ